MCYKIFIFLFNYLILKRNRYLYDYLSFEMYELYYMYKII